MLRRYCAVEREREGEIGRKGRSSEGIVDGEGRGRIVWGRGLGVWVRFRRGW